MSFKKKGVLTQKRLKTLFSYNSANGLFTRIKTTGNRGKVGKVLDTPCDSRGYLKIGIDGYSYYTHRLAWLYMTGEFPDNSIDHVDHNKENNKWLNLREATHKVNGQNRGLSSNNTSGIHGVCWRKDRSKWVVYIGDGKSRENLGNYSNLLDAVSIRKSRENSLGYHPNHGKINIGESNEF